jgi:DNA-binding Lrp family transcriptional regulator
VHLTKLQKRLCNELQDGLPICAKPFDDLAKYLGSDEETVLQEIRGLKEAGIIRRLRALTDYRALGFTGTLVAAHVPEQDLKAVAEAVNSLAQVSHNYRREHHFNLWFTLQAESEEQIGRTLSNLAEQFDIDFHSLPVKRVFKLDVRFDAESEGQALSDVEEAATAKEKSKEVKKKVQLGQNEKKILAGLQGDLELTSKAFEFLCRQGLGEKEVLEIIKRLIDKGVIRRIAAAVDHRKLGFTANVLFCSEVSESKIVEAGWRLARFGMVSHCYERETFEGWPYNLFAMMHARSMGEIQHVINKFIKAEEIDSFELLPTASELKKKPVKYRFGGR